MMRPLRPFYRQDVCIFCRRAFSQSRRSESGHNKWSKIKHDKAAADKVRGKRNTMFSKEIANAVRSGGSADPNTNPRLAAAVETAKRARFPKTSIDTAILRGQGKSSTGKPIEVMTFEAMAPGGVGIIFECETDAKARALQELRYTLGKYDAKVSPTEYLFSRRGRIGVSCEREDSLEYVMDQAIEAGALDVQEISSGEFAVDTEPNDLAAIREKLESCEELTVESLETPWMPKEETWAQEVDERNLKSINALAETLLEYPGIEAVYSNIGDKAMGRLPLE